MIESGSSAQQDSNVSKWIVLRKWQMEQRLRTYAGNGYFCPQRQCELPVVRTFNLSTTTRRGGGVHSFGLLFSLLWVCAIIHLWNKFASTDYHGAFLLLLLLCLIACLPRRCYGQSESLSRYQIAQGRLLGCHHAQGHVRCLWWWNGYVRW